MDLHLSVENLLKAVVSKESVADKPPSLSIELIRILLDCGFDYFSVLSLALSAAPTGFWDCRISDLVSYMPQDRFLLIRDMKLSSIHAMIPRWTGTKYHTAPIDLVVKDILQKCETKEIGISVYHSNFNTANRKSTDDPYALIITPEQVFFLDLNRRRIHRYLYE